MNGPIVRSRREGHLLDPESDILRFEVADLNRVIARACADAELYRVIQDERGHPADWHVLPLSCFAVTPTWTPARLATDTGFSQCRIARASVLLDAGYEIWPTEVYVDDVPDPRNEVHYDLVVATGPGLIPATIGSTNKAERRTARDELAPSFERVLALLGDPQDISGLPPHEPEVP